MRIGKYQIEFAINIRVPAEAGSGQYYKTTTIKDEFWKLIKAIFPDLYYRRYRASNLKAIDRKELSYKSVDFETFLDESSGKKIWNREQLKDRERQGMVMMTHDEATRIAGQYRDRINKENRQRSRKEMRQSIIDMKKGIPVAKIKENLLKSE